MEQKLIIEFKGTNGNIQLFENFVRLNRGGLKNLFIFCETKLDYCFDVMGKFEIRIKELNIETSFAPNKWRPLLIATEILD